MLPRTITKNPALPNLRGVTPAGGEPTETSLAWVYPRGHPGTTLVLNCKSDEVVATRITTVPDSARAVGGRGGTCKVKSHLVTSFDSPHCRWPQWWVNCHLGSWCTRRVERPQPPPFPQWVALLILASCLGWFGSNGLGQEHPSLNKRRLSYLVGLRRIAT